MRAKRAMTRWFAGLMVLGTVVVGGLSPASANGTVRDGTVARSHGVFSLSDTGWNGT